MGDAWPDYLAPASPSVIDHLLGEALGVIDQGLGLLLGENQEVAGADLEDVIDEAIEARPIGAGKVTFEDHGIEAGVHSEDQAGKLGGEARERLHGVLLRAGA
jgi:hypothetical protein